MENSEFVLEYHNESDISNNINIFFDKYKKDMPDDFCLTNAKVIINNER